MTTIDTADSRFAKAVAIADHTDGAAFYPPQRAAIIDPFAAALAQRQSDISSKFVGD